MLCTTTTVAPGPYLAAACIISCSAAALLHPYKPKAFLSAVPSPSSSPTLSSKPKNTKKLVHLFLALQNELGDGVWPPKADCGGWPSELECFKTIALNFGEKLGRLEPSLNDEENAEIIKDFREQLEEELRTCVDVPAALAAIPALSTSQRCAFYACVSWLRSAYRWGTLPIVAIAQRETSMTFPPELIEPFFAARSYFRVATPGSCLYSIAYCNIDEEGQMFFSGTRGLSKEIQNAERWYNYLCYKMEEYAAPGYEKLAECLDHLNDGSPEQAGKAIQQANSHFQEAFQFFFKNLHEGNVSRQHWLQYAQGFHCWGIDGVDGVSGNQAMLIRVLDAFLDLPINDHKDFPDSAKDMFVPQADCDFVKALRSANVRARADQDPLLKEGVNQTLQILRLWRMGHQRKAAHYETVVAPERQMMTSGGGLVGNTEKYETMANSVTEMVAMFVKRLRNRLGQTF